jgi:glycosyltransferase involved in cell wall biosynthesis
VEFYQVLREMGLAPGAAESAVNYAIKQPKDFADSAVMGPIEHSADPLVSCLMVTRGDLGILRFAAECYRRQTWANRELVVVTDRSRVAAVEAFLQGEGLPQVRMVPADEDLTLGDLRNLAVSRSRGEILVQWDDDDLYDPLRLQTAVAVLTSTGAAGAFLSRWLIWWPQRRVAAVSFSRLWEGTGAIWRENARISPTGASGEDTLATRYLVNSQPVATFDAPFQYVYAVTGSNTWPESHFEWLIEGSSPRFESDAYDELNRLLSERMPILDYAAVLAGRG